jgi:hypothetical protein
MDPYGLGYFVVGLFIFMNMFIYMFIFMYIYVFMYTYVYVYVCTYICIDASDWSMGICTVFRLFYRFVGFYNINSFFLFLWLLFLCLIGCSLRFTCNEDRFLLISTRFVILV